ncbi:unnamed protein product [Aphanomyces euteiches]
MYSWGMSDLVARTARYRYRTEDLLWDDDPELKLWLKENNATVKRAQLDMNQVEEETAPNWILVEIPPLLMVSILLNDPRATSL